MSGMYSQQAFGQPTFTDAHASGSSSGCDLFDISDTSHVYHDAQYPSGDQPLQPLQIPYHEQYARSQHFAYALQNSGVSVTGIQYTSPPIPDINNHMPQHFELESEIYTGLDNLQGFSAVTQGYNINAYRTPYPDSNATSTSSATSPDPTNAILLTDNIIVEAEEDKRKRNQAASARFRQKKKQREQHLMERSQEMQEKAKKLEAENDGLKKENLFLKKLLVEKVDHMSDEDRDLLKKAAEGTLDRVSGKKS